MPITSVSDYTTSHKQRRITNRFFWMQFDKKSPSFKAQFAYFCPRKWVDLFHAALAYKNARMSHGQVKRYTFMILQQQMESQHQYNNNNMIFIRRTDKPL